MTRFFTYYSTLVLTLLSGLFTHFNYSYSPHLASVNEINSSNFEMCKDNQLYHFTKTDYRIRTVVIDAGHGGHDHGCSGKHSKEKVIALNIAKKLGGYIQKIYPKIKVIYTRDGDYFVPLHKRAAIANKNNADLFVSIHCNAFSSQKHLVYGTETYVMGLHTADENLDVAKRENAAILLEEDYEKNYDGFDPESPEGHIILSMVQNVFLEQSISFAQKIEHQFKKTVQRKSRGVKQAGFLVLKETTMPSVLIETGYLSNLKEEQFLRSKQGQDDLANGIFRAFQQYKKEIELSNSTNAPILPARNQSSVDFAQPRQKVVEKPKPKEKIIARKSVPTTSNKVTTSGNIIPKNTPFGSKSTTNPTKTVSSKKQKKKLYRVQLAASPQQMNTTSKKWSKVNFPIEIKREDGNFKYLAGIFKTHDEAMNARKKLKNVGFQDAFIVAYRGAVRVPVE